MAIKANRRSLHKRICLTKCPGQHKHWLQRNRIDARGVCRSVGVMKPELIELKSFAPLLCSRCGHVMRLIGSERDPDEANNDLLTYCCEGCDEFLVLPIESRASPVTHTSSLPGPQAFPKHPICPRCEVPMWLVEMQTSCEKVEYFYECKACEGKMSVTDD